MRIDSDLAEASRFCDGRGRFDRRRTLQALGCAVAALSAVTVPTAAALPELPEGLRELVFERLGTREFQEGRVDLALPDRADTGLSVPLTISVPDSPMSDADFVASLHVVTTGNPQPNVADYFFTPSSGLARVSQRMRLAKSQLVLGFAKMSDGSAWLSSKHVSVALGACAVEIFLPDARQASRK